MDETEKRMLKLLLKTWGLKDSEDKELSIKQKKRILEKQTRIKQTAKKSYEAFKEEEDSSSE